MGSKEMNNFKWIPETIKALGSSLLSIIIIEASVCIPFTAFLLKGCPDKVIFWSLFIPWILIQIIAIVIMFQIIKSTIREIGEIGEFEAYPETKKETKRN